MTDLPYASQDEPAGLVGDLHQIAETAEVLGLVPKDQQIVKRSLFGTGPSRGVQAISAIGILLVSIVAVGGLVWEVTFSGSEIALNALSLIATAGVSGLLVLAGAKRGDGN